MTEALDGVPVIRVLAVDTHWSSARGGISTFNRQLCIALARRGAEVYCLVGEADDKDIEEARLARVALLRAIPLPGQSLGASLMNAPSLPPPDLIIGHGRITGTAALFQRKHFFKNAKYLHVVHTAPYEIEQSRLSCRGRRATRAGDMNAEEKWGEEVGLVREADRVLAVGPLLWRVAADYMRRVKKVGKVIRVDPGFDDTDHCSSTPPREGNWQILVSGRLDDGDVKGVDLAVRAVCKAISALDEDGQQRVRLVLRGVSDSEYKKLYGRITQWSEGPVPLVNLHRYTPDVVALREDLREATLVLMPSRAEGFGFVGLEAIVAGVPVLVSRRSGLGRLLADPDVACRQAWDIVLPVEDSFEDAERWGHAIVRVLRDPEAAFDRATGLLQTMRRKRTWARAAERVIEAYSVTPEQGEFLHITAFVCFSEDDGLQFADEISIVLRDMVDHVHPWKDVSSQPRPRQRSDIMENTLQRVDVVLFVQTRDSSREDSWCLSLLEAARRNHIPIIVLQPECDLPLLESLQDAPVVDFTCKVNDAARKQLVRQLEAVTKRGHGDGLASQSPVDETPADKRESASGIVVINHMPQIPTTTFVDPHNVIRGLAAKVKDLSVRLVVLEGSNGSGKTAALKTLRDHPGQDVALHAFVYFSARGYRWITVPTLLEDLIKALPGVCEQQRVCRLAQGEPWQTAIEVILAALAQHRVAVVIDDADALFDLQGDWRDHDLRDLVTTLCARNDHQVVTIMSIPRRTRGLASVLRHSRGAASLTLQSKLPFEETVNLLRNLGKDLDFSHAELNALHQMTGGHPRALELSVCLLQTLDTTVESLPRLIDGPRTSGDGPADGISSLSSSLLRPIFRNLSPNERWTMRALAVFARPVPSEAVASLLEGLVPNYRPKTVLCRLASKYLVYRYEDRYYLPPKPDAEFLLSTLLTREDAGEDSVLTLQNLWLRGVAYLSGKRKQNPTGIDDLWPQFGEIELRLRAEQYAEALDLMDDVDDIYLRRWGQSHVFISWRTELSKLLRQPELQMRNLSYLVAARRQLGGHRDDGEDALVALEHARNVGDERNAVKLSLQLANVLMDRGHLAAAEAHYHEVVGQAHLVTLVGDEARAHVGLSICRAKAGCFDAAEGELRDAFHLVDSLSPSAGRDELRAQLLLNAARLARRRGNYLTGLEFLEEGRQLANSVGSALLVGECLHEQAAHALMTGNAKRAVDLGEQAAKVGLLLDNHQLLRSANTTRCLALLVANEVMTAAAIINAANLDETLPAGLGALVLQGLVGFRQGGRDGDNAARGAFDRALALCRPVPGDAGHGDRDYEVCDARATVLCGLVLMYDGRFTIDQAALAYAEARAMTMERGVLEYNDLIFKQFGKHADPDIIEQVKVAATHER